MKNSFTNRKDLEDLHRQSGRLLSKARIPWKKSKEEVWEDLSVRLRMERQKQKRVLVDTPGKKGLALAATVALLLAVTVFLRYYSVERTSLPGKRFSVEFGDGSRIELNSRTTVRYYPLWWFIKRIVYLDGEAFFNIREGRTFSVLSPLATTDVLGTTFNIYARNDYYQVSCHSGLVRVTSAQSRDFITLSVNEKADLNHDGVFERSQMSGDSIPGWMSHLISFTSAPIRQVFDEIELQYGIIIETPVDLDLYFSGQFSLDLPVENAISIICRPFDLTYEHITGKKFKIQPVQME